MGVITDQLHPVLLEDFTVLREELDADRLRGTSWLVTGATGMLPAYLCQFLAWLDEAESLGMEFHYWVRSAAKAEALFPWSAGKRTSHHVLVPDWNEPGEWTVPETDFIVHAASPATPAACRADPGGVGACNVEATEALLEGANLNRLRKFLFFSSSEVYGDTGVNAFPAEHELGLLDRGSPRSLYPLAKRRGEELAVEAFRRSGLPVASARIFHTYGPGMDLVHDGRVFADFVGNAVRGENILIRSDGTGRRAFCYVRDTVAGLIRILLEGAPGEAYNVGNPEAVLTVAGLADLLVRLVPGKGLHVEIHPDASPQSLSAEVFPQIEKLRNLGWQPRVNPQDGFRRTMEFYLQ